MATSPQKLGAYDGERIALKSASYEQTEWFPDDFRLRMPDALVRGAFRATDAQ
jgi:hypothetical protein